jgi:hypothetical protein
VQVLAIALLFMAVAIVERSRPVMDRIVFTFGTLYDDDVIAALLGRVPSNFYATLSDHSIYKAGFGQLPPKAKEFILSKGYNPRTFSFLFLKPDKSSAFPIEGRAYYLNQEDELVLDRWEGYPDWYGKVPMMIQDNRGKAHQSFVYSGDFDGDRLDTYTRVVNNREKVLVNARVARQEVLAKIKDERA